MQNLFNDEIFPIYGSYTHVVVIIILCIHYIASRHVCVCTHAFKLRIINIFAPIEIRHGVRSLELNNGQLQLFIECPSSISF